MEPPFQYFSFFYYSQKIRNWRNHKKNLSTNSTAFCCFHSVEKKKLVNRIKTPFLVPDILLLSFRSDFGIQRNYENDALFF